MISATNWRLLRPSVGGIEGLFTVINALVFDIDGTVYRHAKYHAEGTRGETAEIASILGYSYEKAEACIAARKQEIAVRCGRSATMTETVMSLGVGRAQWNELRCRAWRPEAWLAHDPVLCALLLSLSQRYRIAFGTNSPVAVGRRVLNMLGVSAAVPDVPIFGPESFSVSKPDPCFFVKIAETLGISPGNCLSLGDREEADGTPAIAAGYADALIVSDGRDTIISIFSQLFPCNANDTKGVEK